MPVSSSTSSAFPRSLSRSAFPRLPSKRFLDAALFETAAISLCSGPQVCSPPRSSLPLRANAAEQPRLLHPSRTCFVSSACIGHANHPIQAIGGVGTYTPRDSQPCRLLQCNRDFSPAIGVSRQQDARIH